MLIKELYTNSQNIFLAEYLSSRPPGSLHRTGLTDPVLGLTDRFQPIRFSASSADPADVELVSQQFRHMASTRSIFSSTRAFHFNIGWTFHEALLGSSTQSFPFLRCSKLIGHNLILMGLGLSYNVPLDLWVTWNNGCYVHSYHRLLYSYLIEIVV